MLRFMLVRLRQARSATVRSRGLRLVTAGMSETIR